MVSDSIPCDGTTLFVTEQHAGRSMADQRKESQAAPPVTERHQGETCILAQLAAGRVHIRSPVLDASGCTICGALGDGGDRPVAAGVGYVGSNPAARASALP